MAVQGTNAWTLGDWVKTRDPDGTTADVVMMLEQTNQILEDCLMVEGNLDLGHQVTVQTGLPDVYWRSFNEGVLGSKGSTAQVVEQCAMLEARSIVDRDLAELQNDKEAFRIMNARMFIEAMNQKWAQTLFYGNPAAPGAAATDGAKPFLGLSGRYSSTTAGNGSNILLGGGSGSDNTSIWLIIWSENTVFCPFPKGSVGGLKHRDLGEQMMQNVNGVTGATMQAYVDWFQWKGGLAVADWRGAVRIANIDVSDLVGVTGTQATTAATHFMKLMLRALDRPESLDAGRASWVVNRTVRSALAVHGMEKQSNVLTVEEGARSVKMSFMGIPVRTCDQIINAEALVA